MIQDVECPYCGQWQEINHDDGRGYEENILHQQDCWSCDKTFGFATSISYHYDAVKVDCMNGSDHNWKPTMTAPKFFTKMRCSMCEQERLPTDGERIAHSIPMSYEH